MTPPHTSDGPRDTLWQGWLELVALVGFAISPLYDLLGRYPEILVANGLGPGALFGLSLVLSFALPTGWIFTQGAIGLVSKTAARGLHLLGIGLFSSLIALMILSPVGALAAGGAILASVVVGACAAGFTARVAQFAGLLRFLSLAALIFPALFLFSSPASDLVAAGNQSIVPASQIERPAPVVLLVMDELPIVSLLDAEGGIDASRYPAFARFAEDATFFPNTATTAAYTTTAIPAILTGSYPERFVLLSTADRFPNSLFSLLSDHYDMHHFEAITQLCAPSICGDASQAGVVAKVAGFVPDLAIIYLHRLLPESLRHRLPSVSTGWKHFAEAAGVVEGKRRSRRIAEGTQEHTRKMIARAQAADSDLAAFIEEIEEIDEIGADQNDRPTLHFFHLIKPHAPFRFLPSGRSYTPGPDFRYGLPNNWPKDPWESTQSYQRHLLQTGFADLQLDKLLNRLREVGIYDDALIVVTADHGMSFTPGTTRRNITVDNQAETALVPFLLKLPGQREGRVDTRGVATVDILPTIADALGAELPWPVDGRSALSPNPTPRGDVLIIGNRGVVFKLPREALSVARDKALARKIALFGLREGNAGLYKIGFAPEMLGKRVDGLPREQEPGRFRVAIHKPEMFRNVDPGASEVPTLIAGEVGGPAIAQNPVRLAIAVNGRIRALTQTYGKEAGRGRFEAMVPMAALRAGKNRIQVFRVIADGGKFRLQAPVSR